MAETTIKTAVTTAATDALLNDAIGKKWYASRTFWVNIIAALALLAQIRYGFIIDSDTQALVLTFVNLILRKITKDPIVF
jgi:hypothetical protein